MELFMRLGIRSVSMNDLAKELGISKKTLYLDFQSKEELVSACLDFNMTMERGMCDMYVTQSENAVDEMLLISKYILQQLRALSPSTIHDLRKYYPQQWSKLEAFHYEEICEVVKGNLERGIEQGFYRSNMDVDIVSKFYVSKAWIIVDEKLFPLREYRRDILFKEHILYHMNGIITTKGKELLEDFKKQFDQN